MSDTFPSLVSTEWLAARIGDPGLVVLDASRHLPAAGRDPRAEFEAEHIPTARFLDLETLTDTQSSVPSALPSAEQLAQRLAELGVSADDRIVIYDDSAVKTSARAWFALVSHGVENVAILDGGLAKWREEGRALEHGSETPNVSVPANLSAPRHVRSKADVIATIEGDTSQIVDARSADRVFGSGIDPVHGGEMGRIPGSLNVPFNALFDEDGTFKCSSAIREAFAEAGVDPEKPVIATCGSGVTACVLIFALHLIGARGADLYDGSWQEWSADPRTPKEQGPA